MSKMVFINFPVSNLEVSTKFYKALGFSQNMDFSDQNASCMIWSDNIFFMLLTDDYYQKFLQNKTIADTKSTSSSLVALSLDSKEAVTQFAKTAKENGGDYFQAEPNKDLDFMFGLEVSDPDGNTLEPFWMSVQN